jgi:hypothetical protein
VISSSLFLMILLSSASKRRRRSTRMSSYTTFCACQNKIKQSTKYHLGESWLAVCSCSCSCDLQSPSSVAKPLRYAPI